MEIPDGYFFAKTDEWVKMDGNTALIGISDYAQSQLSDIVFMEVIVSVGDTISRGKTIGTIESVKAASDVSTPISGKVIGINEKLADTPEQMNTEPYTGAWMLKVELSDPDELKDLMDAASYSTYCETREH